MDLSIIVPVYNVELYIERCINSITAQNIINYEIICINDGSTDKSLEALYNLQKNYPKIKIFNQKNCGPSVARNRGIELSKGKYILFIDSDDYLENNVLDKLLNEAFKRDLDILDFKVFTEYKDGFKRIWDNNLLFLDKEISGLDYLKIYIDKFSKQPFVSPWSHLYKRDFLLENHLRFIEGIYFEDLLFTLESYILAKKVFMIDLFVYNYYNNQFSITKSKHSLNKLKDVFLIIDLYNKLMLKYELKIPMDHLFSYLRFFLQLSQSNDFKEFRFYFKKNPFKDKTFYLYKKRNIFFYFIFQSKYFYNAYKYFFKLKALKNKK